MWCMGCVVCIFVLYTQARATQLPNQPAAVSAEQLPLVVGTMTTIPARFKWLNEAVESIGTQTWPVDVLIIVHPYTQADGTPAPPLPPWVGTLKWITVIRTDEDWGPVGKLLPALLLSAASQHTAQCGKWIQSEPFSKGEVYTRSGRRRKVERHTRIISFDDDRVYSRWTVELLVRASLKVPDAAIGTEGHYINQIGYTGRATSCDDPANTSPRCKWCFRELVGVGFSAQATRHEDLSDIVAQTLPKWDGPGRLSHVPVKPTDVLLGCGGVVYQPRFFELPLLLDFAKGMKMNETCRKVDDVLLSSNLAVRGTPRLQLLSMDSGVSFDWNNVRGKADPVHALASDRIRRYQDNCACANMMHNKHGAWRVGQ